MTRSMLIASAALLVAACGDSAPAPAEGDNRGAEGEVQGGTISDAMIPLDTLTSQSPPMKTRPAAGDAPDSEPAADTPGGEPAPESEAEADEPAGEEAEPAGEPSETASED